MTIETFTWCPQTSSSGTAQLKTRTAQFGDGYQQASGDGLNSKSQSWDLTFIGRESDMRALAAFLDRHQGYRSFAWTPPLGVASLFRSGEYQIAPQGARNYSIAVTFTQAFHP
ncbi:phage tail protein [Pseudomonas otitidis]|uniref:Phage tail protein n=1 Tax=Metapseudomonas otitidis TaxID=319939 RepID=A0A7X3KUK0_9GAMM|nr:phage tail protein [Pseudomonas otitidis]